MKRLYITYALIIISNVLLAADGEAPQGLFEWLDFIVALITFLIGWFTNTPGQVLQKLRKK